MDTYGPSPKGFNIINEGFYNGKGTILVLKDTPHMDR
jgi:hypothetical protein